MTGPIRFGGHTPRPHRHAWAETLEAGEPEFDPRETWAPRITVRCTLCGKVDDGSARRGRNNRARGGRAELAIAREYGGEKVGPLGLKEDVRGKVYKTQVKTHVGLPPRWFVAPPAIRFVQPNTQLYVWICRDVLGSGWMAYAPSRWHDLIENMEGDGRTPRLIERWKPGQGVKPIDWVIVRRQDEPSDTMFTGHFVAWSGRDWLDRYGRDE